MGNFRSAPAYVPINVDAFVKKIEQYLFYEEVNGNDKQRCCFTVISKHYAISYNHGHHMDWKENQTSVSIFNQQGKQFDTTVIKSDPETDFIVVYSENELVAESPVIRFPKKLERYVLLGYPLPDEDYHALEGVISSDDYDDRYRVCGSSGSRPGYSGGPIINYKGQILGINVENQSFFGYGKTISNVAKKVTTVFPSLSIIVPAYYIAVAAQQGDFDFSFNKNKRREEEADEHERKVNGGASEECVDLIVMGVPYDLDDTAMRDYFEKFGGTVAYSEIKRKTNGQSRGFGFVRMNNYRDQVQVLSKAHHCIGGRECQVRISSLEKGVETHLSKMVESRPNPWLFIGGLNDEISRDRLREFFNDHVRRFDKFAQVQDMYCPKPFRNFAFMTVSSQGAAKEIIRQRDFLIDGQMCHVTVAVPKRGEEMQQMPRQQPPQQQPWANNQSQQYKASSGQYAGYGPPPVEMFPSEQRWNAGDGGGGGRGYGQPQFDDDYPPRGGAHQGRSMAAYEPTYPPVDYPPQNRVRQAYDPREDVNLDTYQPISQSRSDVLIRGNEPNIPSAQAEAILNQLPNDAVGTALKMLQSKSIMPNNGKIGDYENGRNGGGGDGRQSPGTSM